MAHASMLNRANPPPTRPPSNPLQASSVPSTPYQHARDFRCGTRSPSPRPDIRGSSPQSIVSEAVSRINHRNGVPVVCKFESGAEIKRRRIPYKDDGNQELAPPALEPKLALNPEEEDKLSGDMRELYNQLLPSAESESRRVELIQKLDRILNQEWPDGDIRVNIFGSSGNLLSSNDSDVDICITTSLRSLESMHSIAHLLSKHGMQKVICRASAKVPIVKCWDPELELSADMNVNNPLALENTRMIKTYVQMDDRVRPLAKIIKHWTKQRCLNDASFGGTISSYTWICMILNFLQRRQPPVLPSLQKIKGKRKLTGTVPESAFADDLDVLKGSGDANKESQAQLLFHFFRHYGYEFDYAKHVVSVREGRLVTREEKGWHPSNYQEKEARNRLCVEEPFTIVRNLGNSADDYAWSGIHTEIRRAFDLIAEGKLAEACEEYVFPPEEKTIFQKPVAKAPVTLRRSASQTNRASSDNNPGRSRKNNRNQSAQRANNRRASSGAAFNNARLPPVGYPISPLAPIGSLDFFSSKGNLHDQLIQQYQFLQAQEDALRSELAAREQAHAHARSNPDSTSAPRISSNSTHGPRVMDGPRTAPILPGPFLPFPHPFARSTPSIGHAMREGAATNPSSPSLKNSVPAYRRTTTRNSVVEGSPVSTRSQSQPGRSLPRPLTLQQPVPQAYDISNGVAMPYHPVSALQVYGPGQITAQLPFSPHMPLHSSELHMPKEYLGYTVTPSPQLLPQNPHHPQFAFNYSPIPLIPPMTLRGPPTTRPRKLTPEHVMRPHRDKSASRSPSPLGQLRQANIPAVRQASTHAEALQSPTTSDSIASMTSGTASTEPDIGGPVIVNGSNIPLDAIYKSSDRVTSSPSPKTVDDTVEGQHVQENKLGRASLSKPALTSSVETIGKLDALATPPSNAGRVMSDSTNSLENLALHQTPVVVHAPSTSTGHAPLLSPVAELRTPSPKLVRSQELLGSTQRDGILSSFALSNRSVKDSNKEMIGPKVVLDHNHVRQGSVPTIATMTQESVRENTTIKEPPREYSLNGPENSVFSNPNPWQQATRKGHKKSKSLGAQRAFNGQALPTNIGDRKGG